MALPPVVFEDEVLLAFDKPGGMPVVAGSGAAAGGSLMARVHAELGRQVANVHRLDPDASGVVLCARTKAAVDFLSGQFQSKTAESICHALVTGAPAQDVFSVEQPLADAKDRPGCLHAVARGGRPARTGVRVLERFEGYALLECRPDSSRLHQIRVHLAACGLPILNDDLYGNGTRLLLSSMKRGYKGRAQERPLIGSLALHTSEITVIHPLTREAVTIHAPLTKELEVALKYLRRFSTGAGRTLSFRSSPHPVRQ